MSKLKRLLLFAVLILSLSFVMFYMFQEKLIFLPTKLTQDYTYSFNTSFEEVFLDSPDGARLNALHFHAEHPKGLILYFHGNAGDLSRWGEIAQSFVLMGYDVLIMDYRTYGKSTGILSEPALHSDAQLFYDYALKKCSERDVLVYGRSLGASIATKVASNNNPKKLLLETPFYNLSDVAQERFPFLPLKYMLNYKFTSNEYIQQVKAPIRIFHGTADKVVSYESGKKLFEVIPITDKVLYTIENGQHNDLSDYEVYQNGIRHELK